MNSQQPRGKENSELDYLAAPMGDPFFAGSLDISVGELTHNWPSSKERTECHGSVATVFRSWISQDVS